MRIIGSNIFEGSHSLWQAANMSCKRLPTQNIQRWMVKKTEKHWNQWQETGVQKILLVLVFAQQVVHFCDIAGIVDRVDGYQPAPIFAWVRGGRPVVRVSTVHCQGTQKPKNNVNSMLQGTNISHPGERKIIFNSTLVGDMLVPRNT